MALRVVGLKITQWIDLGENKIQFFVKDNDDNPSSLPSTMDVLELADSDGVVTVFTNCKFMARYQDNMDGDFLVHPYIYSYLSRG